MNIAVILAGGCGKRMGSQLPKQFLKIKDKTIIEHTIDVFENNCNIDRIDIVMHEDYFDMIEDIISHSNWSKIQMIINGGKERYESSYNAIKQYSIFDNDKILFHDAVRPMVSDRIIDDVITALDKYNAVMTAIPSTDTIVEIEEDGDSGLFVQNIPDRNRICRAQTPQGFKVSIIRQAYEIAINDSEFRSTDDCGVVKKYLPKEKIYIVEGDERNVKITYQEDLERIKRLIIKN